MMIKPVYKKAVTVPAAPHAVFFAQQGDPNDKHKGFVNITQHVKQIEIEPVEGNLEGAHWLRRLAEDGQQVWRTRHPSLQETLWHAEWEYGIKEAEWEASKV